MASLYDPDFQAQAKDLLAAFANAPKPPVHDVENRRTGIDAFFGAIARATPKHPEVEHTELKFPSYDGVELAVHRFVKTGTSSSGPGPAVIDLHGGGMIGGDVLTFRPGIEQKVAATGVPIFSVEYRLAPEHPFPTPIEDCYAGLKWVHENAAKFNVDPARIAVYGASAGGGLATGVALVARDRHLSPPIAKQILVYPMLDARNTKPVDPELAKTFVWTTDSNITGWTAYLGGEKGFDKISPYASPSLADDLRGLPATYLDVGGLDLFKDEDIEYAARLAKANIPVEFHMYPGVPHAFETLGPKSKATILALANRLRAIQSL